MYIFKKIHVYIYIYIYLFMEFIYIYMQQCMNLTKQMHMLQFIYIATFFLEMSIAF